MEERRWKREAEFLFMQSRVDRIESAAEGARFYSFFHHVPSSSLSRDDVIRSNWGRTEVTEEQRREAKRGKRPRIRKKTPRDGSIVDRCLLSPSLYTLAPATPKTYLVHQPDDGRPGLLQPRRHHPALLEHGVARAQVERKAPGVCHFSFDARRRRRRRQEFSRCLSLSVLCSTEDKARAQKERTNSAGPRREREREE